MRSVIPASFTAARKASRDVVSWSPSASNVSSQNGSPAMSMIFSLSSDGLQGTHQVEQPGALEIPAAAERCCRARHDALHVLGSSDEFASHREQGRDGPGDVR